MIPADDLREVLQLAAKELQAAKRGIEERDRKIALLQRALDEAEGPNKLLIAQRDSLQAQLTSIEGRLEALHKHLVTT